MLSETIIENCNYAIRHYNDVEAKKLLPEVRRELFSDEIKKSLVLFQKLKKIEIYLRIVAIPQLSDDEAVDVLKNNYLESFDIEIDMENRLTAKLFFVPEIPRDELRKKLKQALVENQQKLGSFAIGQWIYEFEKSYNVRTRNLSAAVDFVNTHRNALILNPIEKERLKELLHTYDYLLVSTLPFTGPALNNLLTSIPPERKDYDNYSASQSQNKYSNYQKPYESPENSEQKETKLETISFSDALNKYPAVGEQLITSSHIKLKNFPDPVRPSIKNWLSDYTFNMGHETRDSMARGRYIYQNENAKILNSSDRQKLSYILKAYDENSEVTINEKIKQIIFPNLKPVEHTGGQKIAYAEPKDIFSYRPQPTYSAPRQNNFAPVFPRTEQINSRQSDNEPKSQPVAPQKSSIQPDISRVLPSTGQSDYRVPSAKLSFSSPQKMPFENQKPVAQMPIEQKPTEPQPLRIYPSRRQQESNSTSLRNSRAVPNYNVVNLKE